MASPATVPSTRNLVPRLARWVVPGLWLTLPFTAGPAFADALDPCSRLMQVIASTGLWAGWIVAFGLSLVPRTSSLTGVRIVMPASLVAAAWAAVGAPSFGVAAIVALATTAAVTILVLSAPTGALFANGSSYGDERRLPLKPPASLLIGPVQLAWLVCVSGVAAGPLLFAARAFAAGVVLTVIGWPAAWFAARSLHGLSQRWVVFVPAGFVLHDRMALTDPVLIPNRMVASLGPAATDSDAVDYTLGARGLVLQVDLTEPTPVTPLPRRTRPGQRPPLESLEVQSILFAPTRPGAVLREARRRRLPVS
jgi:hypothetical protein